MQVFVVVSPRQRAREQESEGGEMSNVRISNGSPTLERMEARQSESKPSACRNLFGTVDHDELSRDVQRHRREMEEACQQTWNFDFQNYRPLPGVFEWEAAEQGSSPDFYFRPPRPPRVLCRAAPREGLDVNGNCPGVTAAGAQGISEDTRLVEPKTDGSEQQTDLAEQCAGRRKRPATEDPSPQPKRAKTTEEEVSEESPSASSVEQTPKKSNPRRCQT